MSGTGRKEDEVRRMLEGPHPQVPADLAERAVQQGGRLLRRQRVLRLLGLLALVAAAVAFTVWAVTVQPWQVPPAETTPPLGGR
ncbi:hypothetical protein ACFVW8_28775 [Streptomyces sp. NPDC058221]|uniref:hypothetical protein n=1 Tax=Streptomyces sp. NPDC058221 TaxID=3346388 RepID=UPI0036E55591